MNIKELIDKLRNNNIDNNCHDCALGYYAFEAATAITDLLARAEAEEKQRDEARKDCAVAERNHMIEVERRKAAEARAEKAERERDAAVKWIREFTESIGQPCVACKHDTGDYVALGVCGGCSKENNKWEWRGQKEE